MGIEVGAKGRKSVNTSHSKGERECIILFPKSENERGMKKKQPSQNLGTGVEQKNPLPKFRNRKGMKKNSIPEFGNGKWRLSFPGTGRE